MISPFRVGAITLIACSLLVGCKPSDILSATPPTGVNTLSQYNSQSGAEALLGGGQANLAIGFSQEDYGVLEWSGMLSDEFNWGDHTYSGAYSGVAARMTEGINGYEEVGDWSIEKLMAARVELLTAIPLLKRYEPASGRAKVGLAYALMGYVETLVAEDYCAGLPLGSITAAGVVYGTPLTSDSLYGVAQQDFDSALAYANNDPTTLPLAAVGYARTLLDRGNFTYADTVLHNVPTNFNFELQLEPGGYNNGGSTESNLYDYTLYGGCSYFVPTSGKGQNGLNYTSAHDTRLQFDSTLVPTCDEAYSTVPVLDNVMYFPTKFGTTVQSINGVPLATGVEARLIEAEVALQKGQVGTWASDLNGLRSELPGGTYLVLPPADTMSALPADSTTAAGADMQVNVMFRERAFWLYGMGSRLGDMRRLIRQYGRDQSTVFPIGVNPFGELSTLPSPLPNYGTEVNITLPTAAGMGGLNLTDPNNAYKGCTDRSA
jgi:hypothetical protein